MNRGERACTYCNKESGKAGGGGEVVGVGLIP